MQIALRAQPRAWAFAAGVLWIVGFDVLPLAHVVFHEAFGEHSHSAQEHGEHAGLSDHAGHEHDHGRAHVETPKPESELPDSDHGDGSLAHRDLAAQPVQPALPPVPEARLAYLDPRLPVLEDDPSRVALIGTRARAPPRD